jgi:hypothetical protein
VTRTGQYHIIDGDAGEGKRKKDHKRQTQMSVIEMEIQEGGEEIGGVNVKDSRLTCFGWTGMREIPSFPSECPQHHLLFIVYYLLFTSVYYCCILFDSMYTCYGP